MRKLNLIPFLASQLLAFQTFHAPKAGLERPGLHQATVRGRFVSPDGQPVAGVQVQLRAGRISALPIALTQTGADGAFVFREISSPYAPHLAFFPPERWLRGHLALVGESGGESDTGDIRLREDTVIRALVEVVGGEPLGPRYEPTLVLTGKENRGPRVVAQRIGEYLVLRQIPLDSGLLEISILSGNRFETYEAPIRVEPGRRDQLLRIRVRRDTVERRNQQYPGRMEIEESQLPPFTIEKMHRTEGRLLAPDGSPLTDALVTIAGGVFADFAEPRTRTDSSGRFQLSYLARACYDPWPVYGERGIQWDRPAATTETCDQRWKQTRDLTARRAARLPIVTTGLGATQARAYWWDPSLGWQPYSSLQPWVTLAGYADITLKVEADGYLPLFRSVSLPRVAYNSTEPVPALTPVEFRFSRAQTREIQVRGAGRPLRGALVDVELITDIVKNRRRPLKTYSTPANGRLRLAGGGESLIEVFAYAEGFEPARAIWNPGSGLTLDLAPRNATLSFAHHASLSIARVRNLESPQAVRTVWFNRNPTPLIRVAAGTYDVTFYDAVGAVIGYQRRTIGANRTATLDAAVDERPRLTVRYPNSLWKAEVSEAAPPGGATGWTTWGLLGESFELRDVPAVRQSQSPRETEFLLSRAGRVHVAVRQERDTLRVWRELDAKPGESITVTLPGAVGSIRGSIRSYHQGPGSAHGYAGPRLQLIADDPLGWSLTEYMPHRSGDDFIMSDVPAGHYHLHQHLIGEKKSDLSDGRQYEYTEPIDAWGGIPVAVAAGQQTRLKDFIDSRRRDLVVEVNDAAGRPVKNATVRIRDRMSESWRLVEENPGYVREAAHPIPYPAAARLMHGAATLPQVRAGRLEVLVELDRGGSYEFAASVAEEGRLVLRLPSR